MNDTPKSGAEVEDAISRAFKDQNIGVYALPRQEASVLLAYLNAAFAMLRELEREMNLCRICGGELDSTSGLIVHKPNCRLAALLEKHKP